MGKETKLDLYSEAKLVGTIELKDGKLLLSGPDVEGLKAWMKMVRDVRKCKTDAEVFAAMPDVFTGTMHLRSHGNDVGLKKPVVIK